MAWTKQSDVTGTTSFTKDSFSQYVKIQKEHIDFMKGKLTGQFNVSYAFIGASTVVGSFLLGPVWLVAGQAGALAVLNAFYANTSSKTLSEYTASADAGYQKLVDLQKDWNNGKGIFGDNVIVSIKVHLPLMRFKNTVNGDVIHTAASSGVRMVSATTKSGVIFES